VAAHGTQMPKRACESVPRRSVRPSQVP
jgi:hypothetical protein